MTDEDKKLAEQGKNVIQNALAEFEGDLARRSRKVQALVLLFLHERSRMLDDLEENPWIDGQATSLDRIDIGAKTYELQLKLTADQEDWIESGE